MLPFQLFLGYPPFSCTWTLRRTSLALSITDILFFREFSAVFVQTCKNKSLISKRWYSRKTVFQGFIWYFDLIILYVYMNINSLLISFILQLSFILSSFAFFLPSTPSYVLKRMKIPKALPLNGETANGSLQQLLYIAKKHFLTF